MFDKPAYLPTYLHTYYSAYHSLLKSFNAIYLTCFKRRF